MADRRTIVLIFTTFPVATETFLRREVQALNASGTDIELWSLWKGERVVDGAKVRRISLWQIAALAGWLPYWTIRRPRIMLHLLRALLRRPPNRINFGENLLGMALAMCSARHFERRRERVVLHAVWASAPATFGWAVARLAGVAFTFAAHAYDLFEDGGDWLLAEKCRDARWIRTSTQAGAARLRELGAAEEKVSVIRRGLVRLPDVQERPERPESETCVILSVGRLVPKMGYAFQIEVYRHLRAGGFEFRAEIIGEGPQRREIERLLEMHALTDRVTLRGAQPFAAVEEALQRAEVALFTGIIASSGDRAGFPNFIGEAMAAGVPVVATPVGGVGEVIHHRENGLIADTPEAVAHAIVFLRQDPETARQLAVAARGWVEKHFRADRNMRLLRDHLLAICQPAG